MSRLIVELPRDRDRCGRIELLSDKGRRVCGPFPIAGRSSSMLAAAHANPTRFPLLPYGDTPAGNYLVRCRIRSGKGTGLLKQEFGPVGALVLEGITGDAALADANGRFRFLVHGGNPSPEGWLRSTAGGLRMANADLRLLLATLAKTECRSCEVIESDFVSRDPVFDDDQCELPDPPPSSLMGQPARGSNPGLHLPSRGKVLMVMGASFVAQSQVNAEPVREAIVSSPKTPAPRDIHWVPMAATAVQPAPAYNPPAPPPTSSVTPTPSPTLQQIQNGGNTGVIFENSRGQAGSDVNVHPQISAPEVSGSPAQGGSDATPVQPSPSVQPQPQSSSPGDAAYQHYLEKQQQQQQDYNQRSQQVIQQINQQQATPPAAVTPPPPPAPPPAPAAKKKSDVYEVQPPPPKPERGR